VTTAAGHVDQEGGRGYRAADLASVAGGATDTTEAR
jgi:hypothetical protein